jgi:hypothetical protein
MSDTQGFFAAFQIECTRLGLDWRDLPGLASEGDPESERNFLHRLRAMSPGVTWHDVFPDLPIDWIPDEPETWTTPYRPLGDFDHQVLPTSPAVRIAWARRTARSCLAPLVSAARAAGFQIFGAEFDAVDNPDWPWLTAAVVFDRGVQEADLDAFLGWLEGYGDGTLLSIIRTGNETYEQA